MKYEFLLFDLDGTISDPIEGIAKSFNYSLAHYGYDILAENELSEFISPPIDETFKKITGSKTDSHISQLIVKYRESFSVKGYSENTLYPGVVDMLKHFHSSNIPMAICTSKRKDYAEKIIKLFKIDSYFKFIDGGDVGIHKREQIESLLKSKAIPKNTLMVGDRSVDITSAKSNSIFSAGVLWGYGSLDELNNEKPDYIFESFDDMVKKLC